MHFIKHPFRIRVNEIGDRATFNEVMLRKDYDIGMNTKPLRILDCGANIGLSSIFFANQYPEANIISVEPEIKNYEILKENTNPYPQIETIRGGIWSRSTWVKVIDGGKGSNAFTIMETSDADKDGLPSLGIHDIMMEKNWDHIDLLKIDIEGGEKEIFTKNHELWLPKVKILIVETHDRYITGSSNAVFKAIINYDFSCKIKGSNFVFYKN